MDKKAIRQRRCFNHAQREAAARCPECWKDYCRECITEQSGKLLCANCLKAKSESKISPLRIREWLIIGILVLAGILSSWLFFYFCARVLAAIPDRFHHLPDQNYQLMALDNSLTASRETILGDRSE